jgi:hypothetical protein
MTNFCQLPRGGEILYRCGWTAAASPIGVCRFAVPCVVFQSRCTLRAGEYCISSRAQAAADIAAERRNLGTPKNDGRDFRDAPELD